MRYHEFLLEYRRDVTAQKMGDKLIQAFSRIEKGHNVPDSMYGAMTLAKMVYDPHLFAKGKTVSFDVMGTYVTVNPETVSEVLQTRKPAIVDAILTQLEDGDPTAHKEYTQWIAARYITGDTPLEDIGSTLKEYLYKFVTLKRKKLLKPPANDINRYNSFGNFMDVMDEYELPEDELAKKGRATEVYEDASVRVLVPEDQDAACYYGRGTRWCTAATKGTNYYSQYSRQGPLYILLPKTPTHPGEKYQLHFPSKQFMDEGDDPVDLYDLLVHRFDMLLDFFKQQESTVGDYIIFADDKVLNTVLDQIKSMAMDHFWDEVNEWEAQDDYWNNWRVEQARERGYVDAEGDIDWDQVMDDERLGDYLDWNDELATLRSNVEVALDYGASGVREFILRNQDGGATEYGDVDLSKLPEVMSDIIRYEVGGRHNDDNFMSDFVNRRIDVRTTRDLHHPTAPPWIVRRV
jgi:hypothetical protein